MQYAYVWCIYFESDNKGGDKKSGERNELTINIATGIFQCNLILHFIDKMCNTQ